MVLLLAACSDYDVEKVDNAPDQLPIIQVEPPLVDFGTLPPGCLTEHEVTVRNIGDAVLSVTGASADGDGFSVEDLIVDLDPGAETQLTVRFDPSWEGDYDGTIEVRSNDTANPAVPVALDGLVSSTVATTEVFTQPTTEIDVLWVMDNSSSMSQEQDRVAADITSFFSQFEAYGADYHMGVITTDIVNPEQSGRLVGEPAYVTPDTPNAAAELAEALAVGEDDMGNESGLAAAELSLTEPVLSTDNIGFYRADATLAVVFLSDEPEQSEQDAQHYIDFFTALKPDPAKISVSAIVGDEKTGCATECDGAAEDAQPGDKYVAVARAMGGVFLSLCTCDISPGLAEIGADAVSLLSTFALSATPAEGTMTVYVDGSAAADWSYDTENNAIDLDTPPAEGATVTVTYAVATECPSA